MSTVIENKFFFLNNLIRRHNFTQNEIKLSNKESAGRAAYLEKHRTHTNSSTSQRLTKASALPVAKYFPMGSNLIQMQLEGWALMDCTGFSSG